jgi:Protein of unknown function (DUF2971)
MDEADRAESEPSRSAPPPRLYKYQSLRDEHTISNLSDCKIWLSKPQSFNDPYDCDIRIERERFSDEDLAQLAPVWRERVQQLYGMSNSDFDSRYVDNGRPNAEFGRALENAATTVFDTERRKMRCEFGVACFSAKCDDLLMWSHYADGHRGICLEFDASFHPFSTALRVRYSNSIPYISVAHMLLRGYDQQNPALLPMITTKATCWSYEEEWRVFHPQGGIEYPYPVNALIGVYLGYAMSPEHRIRIIRTLGQWQAECYDMKRSEDEFRLTPARIYSAHQNKAHRFS